MLDFLGVVGGGAMLLLVAAFLLGRRGNPLGPTLVLRRFAVTPAGPDTYIEIRGRAEGLAAAILTALSIDTETTLAVTRDRFMVRQGSFSGLHVHECPLTRIASTSCAYYQPTWALLVAALATLGGLGGFLTNHGSDRLVSLVMGLVVAGVFAAVFVLGRKITLTCETAGGQRLGVVFKPSVVERVSVDIGSAREAIELLSRLVMASNS